MVDKQPRLVIVDKLPLLLPVVERELRHPKRPRSGPGPHPGSEAGPEPGSGAARCEPSGGGAVG